MIIIIGLIFLTIGLFYWAYKSEYDADLQFIFGFCNIIALICMLIVISVNAIKADYDIEQNKIQYESLVQRLEIINTEYEDVSKSDVIKDVSEWNKMVNSKKYWNDSPLTNVFYSNKVVENLEYIEIKKGE